MNIGQKLKQFRKRSGISQMQLEIMIDAAPGSISRLESNNTNPTKETLFKISQALQLTYREFIYLSESFYTEIRNEEIETAKEIVSSILNNPNAYAYLLDNRSCIVAFSKGFLNEANSVTIDLDHALGKHVSELVLDDSLGISQIFDENTKETLIHHILDIIKMERAYLLHEPWWNKLLNNILQYPKAQEIWATEMKRDIYSEESRTFTFQFPSGAKKLSYYYTILHLDPRFTLVEYKEVL